MNDIATGGGMHPVLVEVHRTPVLECVHRGSIAVCRPDGSVEWSVGTIDQLMLPRSACKMIQALPLLDSGAAGAASLTDRHLALACASHNGAAIHTELVTEWLSNLELGEAALRCGPQMPNDRDARETLIQSREAPDQRHNNCSGKHTGMLTLNRYLSGGAEYLEIDHPVQRTIRQTFADLSQEDPAGFATDGCSAPNFAITLRGLATAVAGFADPGAVFSGSRAAHCSRLVQSMMTHPDLVAGEGRACTALMRAAKGRAAVKTGAEGVFTAILPEAGLGIAMKIDDGATRASEAAMAALLVRYGALDADDPVAVKYYRAPLLNRRALDCGTVEATPLVFGRA